MILETRNIVLILLFLALVGSGLLLMEVGFFCVPVSMPHLPKPSIFHLTSETSKVKDEETYSTSTVTTRPPLQRGNGTHLATPASASMETETSINSEERIRKILESLNASAAEEKNLLHLPDDMFMDIQDSIQSARKQRLHNMCQKYHKGTPDPVRAIKSHVHNEFFVNDKHRIVMCVTPKIAGKSWKRVFNVLAGLSENTTQDESWRAVTKARKIKRLTKLKHGELKSVLQNYTFIMFSRHPLSRTLSAYNNKLSPNSTDYRNRKEFWKVGYKIMAQYRPKTLSLLETEHRKKYDLTFEEFVRYLIDREKLAKITNTYWMENYKFCRPCDINYTVIGRYETLLPDAKYILKLTKVDDIVSFPETEGLAGNSTQSSDLQKLISYYEKIPVDHLQQLIKRYELDYVLFNYTMPLPP